MLTKKERARKSAIVGELVRLSRDGWSGARAADWQPLERELAELQAKEG